MIKKLKSRLRNNDHRIILGNFSSLSFLQVANYIFPLITLPYLVRVLGVEKYGLIAFARAVIEYFIVFSEYGFKLSATRSVSTNRHDQDKISEIFSSVMFIKLCLIFISFIILLCLIFFVPRFQYDYVIYIFAFIMVLGKAIFPVWFFQGMQEMKYITFLNIASKLIFTISIFILINSKEDFIFVPLIDSLGFLIAGIIGAVFAVKKYKIKFSFPKIQHIKQELKDGWNIFISMISINLYTTTNTVILGFLTNNETVGYFAVGQKIIRIVIRVFSPISQAIYPYISKLAVQSKERAEGFLKKLVLLTSSCFFVISLIIFIFSPNIVKLILGNGFSKTITIMRILCPLIVLIPIADIFANLTLLPFKLDKYFSKIYISGGIVNIVMMVILLGICNLGGRGAAIANISTELILTIVMLLVIIKHNIKIL